MCIKYVNSTFNPPSKTLIKAFKVFYITEGILHPLFSVCHRRHEKYKIGTDYTASDEKILVIGESRNVLGSENEFSYNSGFHSFVHYKDAVKLFELEKARTPGTVLAEVYVTNIVAFGLDTSDNLGTSYYSEGKEYYECYVSKNMKILKILLD